MIADQPTTANPRLSRGDWRETSTANGTTSAIAISLDSTAMPIDERTEPHELQPAVTDER